MVMDCGQGPVGIGVGSRSERDDVAVLKVSVRRREGADGRVRASVCGDMTAASVATLLVKFVCEGEDAVW